jgi:hypothetical protein
VAQRLDPLLEKLGLTVEEITIPALRAMAMEEPSPAGY